jgi:hypothetical protein
MSRICVSLPVHEWPAVVFDQVENIRAFLPSDTLIVLHLSQGFAQPDQVQRLVPDGVLVNPTSYPTGWGEIIHVHNSNIEFARSLEAFDFVLLHASNDMYVRDGAGTYISKHEAGFNSEPVHANMRWGMQGLALQDSALMAMMQRINASEMYASQIEGSFYNAALFSEMTSLIGRHWNFGDGESFAREEIYYPTLAAKLFGTSVATPTIYSESTHSEITAGHIWRIAEGRYRETSDSLSHGVDMRQFAKYDYDNIYGVKRIVRNTDDPMRLMIRGLTRSMRPQMRVPSPVASENALVTASMDDLLENPEGLWMWAYQFRADDQITLLVLVNEDDNTQQKVNQFIALATHAGLDTDNSANVEVLTVKSNDFVEASLRWSALARYEVNPPQDRLHDLPVFGPRALGGLRELATHSMQN